ncbi:amino acid transporter [Auriscalpium vulgare]|uniref:Amino acid transporter n=1 Tax=Auriscalpium vulgare TaxID=40419 RepID=A0ACB8RZZ4_9AGAM|nr:amino acid transporter [Auriscalpium vulgare]
MLNLGQLLGSGIFSVPGVVLNSVGSVGLLLTFWVIAPIFAFVGLAAYTELASMFPNRSGAEVVFLEQAYPHPRFFVPVAFAVTAVLLSFSATNSVVFAQYFLAIFDIPVTEFRQTSLALAVATFCVGAVGVSTKWSLKAVNFLTAFKVLSLAFIALTGIAVLTGLTRITHPFANFENLWAGGSSNPNALATALVKTNFAFVGWANAFNVLAEVKGKNPVRTVRNAGYISLGIVTALFFLVNVAYVAAVPIDEIKGSGQLVAALFFKYVFGEHWASKILPILVVLSCVGNITVGQARVIREVARQGLLPYPQFFASTKPWGTPLAPVGLKYLLTAIVILALPAKDAFNFLLDLASYPHLVFTMATGIGIWVLRRRRAAEGFSPSPFKVWNSAIIMWLVKCAFLLIMPWVPPEEGHGDVSFWYATYCVVGIGILALCAVYYYVWIILLPRIGGYEIVEEVIELGGGARTTHLVRKYHTDAEEERPLLASSSS